MTFLLFFFVVRKGKLKGKPEKQNLKEPRSEVLLRARALQNPPRIEFEGGLRLPYFLWDLEAYKSREKEISL